MLVHFLIAAALLYALAQLTYVAMWWVDRNFPN